AARRSLYHRPARYPQRGVQRVHHRRHLRHAHPRQARAADLQAGRGHGGILQRQPALLEEGERGDGRRHQGDAMTQLRIAAIYMRGGTSKGVFFHEAALPPPGPARDRLLLRVIGSPDPYGKQIDGMGAATSSTSKTVILSRSSRPDCDVDYLFGQVAIDKPVVDWSG